MDQTRQAALCIVTGADRADSFQRTLKSILEHTPAGGVELRLGFIQAGYAFHYALGASCPDGAAPQRHELPGGIERFSGQRPKGCRCGPVCSRTLAGAAADAAVAARCAAGLRVCGPGQRRCRGRGGVVAGAGGGIGERGRLRGSIGVAGLLAGGGRGGAAAPELYGRADRAPRRAAGGGV